MIASNEQPLHTETSLMQGDAFRHAVKLVEEKKYLEAKTALESLLQSSISDSGVWCNLGICLRALKQLDAAVIAAARAVSLAPDDPIALTNYGNCLTVLDRGEEAIAALAKAAQLMPEHFTIRLNHAIGLREFCRFDAALAEFDAAIALKPDDINARWEKSLIHLQLGAFSTGWKNYELRWKRGNLKEQIYKAPRWSGEGLNGKTILVYEEQGYGDTILCSRFIPALKERGARVLFGCRQPLRQLLQSVPGIDRVVDGGKLGERFHYHSPIMSLPGVLGTEISSVPPPPTMWAAPTRPPEALKLLELGKARFRVGIVWSGNPNFVENHKRAVAAARFLPLAAIPGIQLYSLQKGLPEKELAEVGANALILRLGPHLHDFADTAAVLKHLDLVIMTDSAVAHLAGSMGVPVWNLLCYRPFWVYQHNRTDSPFYPSMRLFRQSKPGDWEGVFKNVAAELASAAARKRDGQS